MSIIRLETIINAPAKTCFDISRSADAHLQSMQHTGEKIVAGRTSGLFELNDTVTWEAKHFGIRQQLTVKITKLEPYTFFQDEMVRGAFKKFEHQHYFEEQNDYTIMKDVFSYEVPGWIFGKIFDALILKRYMIRLLLTRNSAIRQLAEKSHA